MRTVALLVAFLLAGLATPLALASEGHDEAASENPEATEAHDVVGASSPELLPGESWTFTMTEEGTFDYHCHPHPWMLGQLTVLPSNGNPPQTHVVNFTEPVGADFEAWTFSPKTLEVRIGDNVTWVNVGSVMHRVTQTVGEHIAHVGTLGGAGSSEASDVHTDGEAAHVEGGHPSPLWWIAVAAAGTLCVGLWVKGGKKAP